MVTTFAVIVSTVMLAPFLVYVVVFTASKKLTGQHKKSVRLALDVTTPFFIGSAYFMMQSLWANSFGWLILLTIGLIGIVFSLYLRKNDPDFAWGRFIKGFWRLNFLVFFLVYLALSSYGVIREIIRALST